MAPGARPAPSKKNDNTDGRVFSEKRVLRLPKEQVLSYYKRHHDFRRAVDSGKYIYIDGLFVLRPIAIILLEQSIDVHSFFRSPKLFGDKNGLTAFCLCEEYFFVERKPKPNELYHSARKYKGKRIAHAEKVASIDTISQEMFRNITSGGGQEPPFNFGGMLSFFMELKDVTEEGLAELTGISDRTIRRYKNDEGERPTLENVVAIGIALHLFPHQIMNLLGAAGYQLRKTPKERAYQYLIDAAYNNTVYECNEFLKKSGMSPLTNL
ncbi:helix-turn-helix domain-containing protein [Intestinibacillus massiliensis]|uniref:helix-turn-helix domain-containing protein n=1 Tax=Intestinibacillus massiliensis TaxID=1871029 RepID=UPI000B351D4F|nr:helix-turn-helix transcriptional regulator [Intestinibacillus massiliensis]